MPSGDGAPDPVLQAIGVDPRALIGAGDEAWVYGLDEERVVRVLRATDDGSLVSVHSLLAELGAGPAPFALPEALELGSAGGHIFVIERRLPGRDVGRLLAEARGRHRRELIEAHLDAAAALGDLPLGDRRWFGDLCSLQPIRADTWTEYAAAKLQTSVAAAPAFADVDVAAICRDLPPCDAPAFVHMDAFVGNMLAVGTTITAVLDVGITSLAGDRRLDPLTAAVYLGSDEITPSRLESDTETVLAWLRNVGLDSWYEPARRFVAAYWAWAVDDESLNGWCRRVLLG